MNQLTPISTGLAALDLGKLDKGSVVTFGLLVFNNTEEPIKLTPWAGCGCTTPTLSQDTIQPKANVILTVVFDTAGKSGIQEKSFGINYKQGAAVESCTLKLKAII